MTLIDDWCQNIHDYVDQVLNGRGESLVNPTVTVGNYFTRFQKATKWRFENTPGLEGFRGMKTDIQTWIRVLFNSVEANPYHPSWAYHAYHKKVSIVVGMIWGTISRNELVYWKPTGNFSRH